MKSWSVTTAVAILCVSCAGPESSEQKAGDLNRSETGINESGLYPLLSAIRFKADADTLKLLEKTAREAGWAETRKEAGDTILVVAPIPYSQERFKALLDGLDAISGVDVTDPHHFTMQLLGPDGKPVDADGKPVSQN